MNDWDTAEARAAEATLYNNYFLKSTCSSDCPTAWAPDVLNFFAMLDKEFGIQHNTETMGGYTVNGSIWELFVKDPIQSLIEAFKSNFLSKEPQKRDPLTKKKSHYNFGEKLKNIYNDLGYSYSYAYRGFKVRHINPLLNKIQGNQVKFEQFKEKYGSLRFYYSAPEHIELLINKELNKLEIRLALSGTYSTLEHLYNTSLSHSVNTEHHPDDVSVTTHINNKGEEVKTMSKTVYRQLMKDMGINLEDFKKKV